MLRLNSGTRGEHLPTQFCWAASRLIVTCLSPINPVNGLLLFCSKWCAGHELLRSGERCVRVGRGPEIYADKRS